MTITGQVNLTGATATLSGYSVLLDYQLVVQVEAAGDAPATEVTVARRRAVTLAADGSFSFILPETEHPRAPIALLVKDPTGEVAAALSLEPPDLDDPIVVEIRGDRPFVIRPVEDGSARGATAYTTGRAISSSGRPLPAGASVTVWGRREAEGEGAEDELLAATRLQGDGYFSLPRPTLQLSGAFGRIQNSRPIPIPLTEDRLPDQIVLVVEESFAGALRVNQANAGATPRLPSAIDLVENGSAFSQDLGSSCVELAVPNRVLEEFAYRFVVRVTEPQVRQLTQGGPPLSNQRMLEQVVAYLKSVWLNSGGDARDFDLTATDLEGLDEKTLNRLLDGFSGLTLKEEAERYRLIKQIRQLMELVRQTAIKPGRAALNAFRAIDWDDTPTLNESATLAVGHVLHYRQVWRADGYSLGDLLYSLPLAPGQKRKIAILDWERRTQATRSEMMEEEEYLSAFLERDRDILEIVGSNLRQEVDASSSSSMWGGGGGIGGGFIGSGWGIFGGFAGGGGGASTQARQDASRELSAQSLQQLRDNTSQRASALRDMRSTVVQTLAQNERVRAQTEVVANYNHCHSLTVEYFEVLRHFQISHELVDVTECLFVPLPMSWFDQAKVLRWRDALSHSLMDRRLRGAFDAIQRISDNWVGWNFPPNRYSQLSAERLEGEMRISFVLPRPRDKADGAIDPPNWGWLGPFIGTTIAELYNTIILPARQEERDRIFRQRVAPVIAERMVNQLRFSLVATDGTRYDVPLDASLVSRFEEGVPLYITLRPAGAVPALARENIAAFSIRYEGPELPEDAQVIVHSGKVRWVAEVFTGILFDEGRILNDLNIGDEVTIGTPVSRDETRDPREEDRLLATQLLRHLNDNLERYHRAIWVRMDPARRFMLLDGVIVPNTGGLSVASLVENQVIGVVGNSLVMPVAPGFQLDPTLSTDPQARRASLLDLYATNPAPPLRVSTPTRGVFAEAVLGECNSCEVKDDSLFWRWEESPIPDEPPALLPLSTQSRQTETPEATPTALPSPIVQFQQLPEIPDPTGLRTALEILQKSDLFTDITGLEQTQRNALTAFEKALSVAKSFGGQAAQIALQQETGRNIDRTLQQLESARQSGALSQDQASRLTYDTLRTLTGAPPQEQATPLSSPAVQQAVESAAQAERADVSVATPGETVEAQFDDTGGEAHVGAGPTTITATDISDYVSLDFVLEDLAAGPPGAFTFTPLPPFRDLVNLGVNLGAPGDLAALLAGGPVRPDPGDPTRFQARIRLQLVFPARAANPARPVGTGKLPLAVLVHGNHEAYFVTGGVLTVDKESYKGYRYLQDELAKLGIASISVDTNIANQIGSLIELRADIALEAIKLLKRRTATAGDPLFNRINFDRIALMGHSRGGDAVVRMVKKNSAAAPADRFGIRTVCSLAPTDFTGGQVPARRTFVDQPELSFYSVLYGALDGDVAGEGGSGSPVGTGFRHYDRARCPKALVFAERCCHNSFNSVWHADGIEGRIRAADRVPGRLADEATHQALAKEFIAGQFAWHLKGVSARNSLFNGATASATGLKTVLLWSFGNRLEHVDDFENPAANLVGGVRQLNSGAVVEDFGSIVIPPGGSIGDNVMGQTHVVHTDLAVATGSPFGVETTFPAGRGDLTSFTTLALDVGAHFDITDEMTIAGGTPPTFSVILHDAAGGVAILDSTRFSPAMGKPFFHELSTGVNVTALWVQTLRAPLSLFSGADLHNIVKIQVEVAPSNGHLFIDHIKLAAF